MNPTFKCRTFSTFQMQIVLVNECIGNFNKRYLARQAAVIPPIGLKRGDVVFVARVVYSSHYKILARMYSRCYIAVEACISTLVLAGLLPIDPEIRAIVSGAYVQKDTRMFLGLVTEIALIPDRSLIEEERRALRIPIPRHLDLRRLRKVVLDRERIPWLGLTIQEPTILLFLVMKAVKPGKVRIDNRTPFAFKRHRWPPVRASHHNRRSEERRVGKECRSRWSP